MSADRIHHAVAEDGTPIRGRVHGQGPPLVLVPGGPADGETGWVSLLPHLTDHFACFTVNTRGRGLSGDHPDHSRERVVGDLTAFLDSIGDGVLLFGHSAGGTHALEAAARSSAVTALAVYEPALLDHADAQLHGRFTAGLDRARRLSDDGRPAEAAQVFCEELALANDRELALLAEVDATADMAPLVPVFLREVARSGPPRLSDPALVDQLTMPALLLHGTRTHPFYTSVVDDLVARLPDATAREIEGVGHLGPEIGPEPVAAELVRFHAATTALQRG